MNLWRKKVQPKIELAAIKQASLANVFVWEKGELDKGELGFCPMGGTDGEQATCASQIEVMAAYGFAWQSE